MGSFSLMNLKKYKYLEAYNLFFDQPIFMRMMANQLSKEVAEASDGIVRNYRA